MFSQGLMHSIFLLFIPRKICDLIFPDDQFALFFCKDIIGMQETAIFCTMSLDL